MLQRIFLPESTFSADSLNPVLNWANYYFAEHGSDSSTNYSLFLNLVLDEDLDRRTWFEQFDGLYFVS